MTLDDWSTQEERHTELRAELEARVAPGSPAVALEPGCSESGTEEPKEEIASKPRTADAGGGADQCEEERFEEEQGVLPPQGLGRATSSEMNLAQPGRSLEQVCQHSHLLTDGRWAVDSKVCSASPEHSRKPTFLVG